MTADLFAALLATTRARLAALAADEDLICAEIEKLTWRREVVRASKAELEAVLACAPKDAPAAPVKAIRAKPGEIEAAIRRVLFGHPNSTQDEIADACAYKPDSAKVVLKRLVAMGEALETNGLYRLKDALQKVAAE